MRPTSALRTCVRGTVLELAIIRETLLVKRSSSTSAQFSSPLKECGGNIGQHMAGIGAIRPPRGPLSSTLGHQLEVWVLPSRSQGPPVAGSRQPVPPRPISSPGRSGWESAGMPQGSAASGLPRTPRAARLGSPPRHRVAILESGAAAAGLPAPTTHSAPAGACSRHRPPRPSRSSWGGGPEKRPAAAARPRAARQGGQGVQPVAQQAETGWESTAVREPLR